MKNKIISISVATIVVFALIWNFSVLNGEQIDSLSRKNRLLAMQELTFFSDRIQMKLNTNIQYADFFAVLLSRNPDLSKEELKEYADLFLEENGVIKNVAFAPDGIVETVFPLEGNEAALGHDLFNDVKRSSFVKDALENRKSVTQGPVEAMQGGHMVFNRKAVFINDNGTEKFWGLTVITIDFEELVSEIEITSKKDGYLIALRAPKTDGTNDFLWGSTQIFENKYISKMINLPDQQWELAIYPEKGWTYGADTLTRVNWLFIALIVGAFYTVYRHAQNYQDNVMTSRKDPLTGTLNKTAFRAFAKKQLSHKEKKHGICVMDFNGFKMINDTYGHPVGDKVLIEIAQRIQSVLREADRVSRFGGDEYIVFLSDIEGENDIKSILERISDVISEPLVYDDIKINISIAWGYALSPDDSNAYEELYETADRRMYENKSRLKAL
ncbi:diguanylate cyclase domain-containing protein [Proteocatella sphenisci]|uniref:diguanylate cyclase domain-containing protein n=1 Tax=Proteocatella sphenisci TaxID=181070 RepID=UPI0004BC4747|nr:diguanylate cyclase [Proteocatella sphenisci]